MNRLHISLLFSILMMLSNSISAQDTTQVTIRVIETSDIHGNLFPYDFINRKSWNASLANIDSYVKAQRDSLGNENVILLDNGDILQGQPTVYYYNFLDTASTHIVARMMNHMGYDAASVGNHDIEAGHAVYDRWFKQCDFPFIGANIINTATDEPYIKPYTIIERHGIKFAILGLTTPGIPAWLPENLWSGLRFDDMAETARKWVDIIHDTEKPDFVIGLFHSGVDSTRSAGPLTENASELIARNIPGFDLILCGHDHRRANKTFYNIANEQVSLLNPANNGILVAVATITFTLHDGKVINKQISTQLETISKYTPTAEFNEKFNKDKEIIEQFVSQPIGYNRNPLKTRDAYFGPSAFVDLIHTLQLSLSGAEISMAAPLSYDATIDEGEIKMSDMFNLYKYENMLYVMNLSGKEIKDYLEMSYDLWISTIKTPEDHLLRLTENSNGILKFENPTFNFDSAAGIIYTVDATKEKGQRISISSMSDGTSFDPERIYRVAINSYRGNGGGNLLTQGAGILADELTKRITWATDIDLRFHLMNLIKKSGTIEAKPLNHWKFIPQDIVAPAIQRDRKILFGE